MLILYLLLVAYILAVNFYAFLLVKSLRDKEVAQSASQDATPSLQEPVLGGEPQKKPAERVTGKLCITGLLGGAITVYLCMFLLKYRRSDLLLMIFMPLLGVLNVYLWVLLFRSGFTFLTIR